jgi:hypothetical protein
MKLRTPVRHHGLDLLELCSSHDEPCEVCGLELVRNMGRHDCCDCPEGRLNLSAVEFVDMLLPMTRGRRAEVISKRGWEG